MSYIGTGCLDDICSDNGLTVQADSHYKWRAAEFVEQLPYVCTYKCSQGMVWYETLQRCGKMYLKEEEPK